MRPGFVLIEILVAIALGAMIMAGLFTSFFQINKAIKMADQAVEYDARAVLVYYQLERDLSGAMVPYEFVSQKETTTQVKVTEEVQDKDKKTETTQAQATKKETVKKEEPLERSFYAEVEGGNLKNLTFITSNPLPAYDSIKPRIARVTYQLVPEQQRQGQQPSYRLMRDEQATLKFAQPKTETAQGYELVRGIRSLKVEYRARPPKKEEEKKKEVSGAAGKQPQKQTEPKPQAEEKKKEKPPYEKFPAWGKEQVEKIKQNLPQFVDVVITFWDRMRKQDRSFEFKISIPVRDPMRATEKQDEKKGDEKKTPEAQTTPEKQTPESVAQTQRAAQPALEDRQRQMVVTVSADQRFQMKRGGV